MIYLTYNCKGLANLDKRLALKALLAQHPIDILFLLETLGDGNTVTSTLLSILPNWTFITLGVRGRSEGCAMGINNRTIRVNTCWGRDGVLGMDVKFSNSETPAL